MKMDWHIITLAQDGPYILKGSSELEGVCRVTVELPEVTLQTVRAILPLKIEDNEKIFMNGYQTWTHCPEYTKKSKIRGIHRIPKAIVNAYGLDRYGDYHFVDYPYKKGITHGFSYCYFRCGDRYRLIGSLDEKPGYTMFTYNAKKGFLTIERDCADVKVSGQFHAFDLFYAEGSEQEVFDGWFAAMECKRLPAEPIAGYSSWYNRYQAISAQTICADLEGCQKVMESGDLFQIDDGWEPFVGDWLDADRTKFPNGLRPIAQEIHAAGFQAGLWLAPFVCQKGSKLMELHPDWLLQVNGEPWCLGSNWGGFYSLDIDHSEVKEYLRRVFDRVLNEWGFDLVKLDFLYGAAPFGTETESRAARMIRAMDFLREICADKKILGCGVPVMPAFGRVEYCRVSCDVGLDWDDVFYMRWIHRERVSTKQAIENSVFRRQLNGRAYLSDPDVFFLRENNIKLNEEEKGKLAIINALVGGVFLTSDDPGKYGAAQIQQYTLMRTLTHAENVKVDTDNGICIRYSVNGKELEIKV